MKTPKLRPHSDIGDLMPAEEWLHYRDCGIFIPDDGSGYWSTRDGESEQSVWTWVNQPEWATHVMWYNK